MRETSQKPVVNDGTMEFLAAFLAAAPDRREAAVKVLRGNPEPERSTVQGPLLMGMGAGAQFLGVSRATLWRAMQAGTIEKVELFAGSFRVRREDLVRLAQRKEVRGKRQEGNEKESKRGRPCSRAKPPAVVRSTLRGKHTAGQADGTDGKNETNMGGTHHD